MQPRRRQESATSESGSDYRADAAITARAPGRAAATAAHDFRLCLVVTAAAEVARSPMMMMVMMVLLVAAGAGGAGQRR